MFWYLLVLVSVTDLILFKIKGTSEYFLLALEVLQHIILLHWKLPIRYEYHFVIVFLFQFLDFDMWLLITVISNCDMS